MSKIVWDAAGERTYETGVDHGVLYVYKNGAYGTGVAWNGLTAVTESPSGAEATAFWADNIKYLNLMSAEDFGCTIEAYTYPDEFGDCDGSAQIADGVYIGQQKRAMFGFTYRTIVGNDTDNNDHGYKIHIVYGCLASPSEKNYQTVNDNPDLITFSWTVSTTPVVVNDINDVKFKPTAHLEIDSTKLTTTAQKEKLEQLEDLLYGTDPDGGTAGTAPSLPLPNAIATLIGLTQ